ncbi:MAG: sigma 54-interacting transcriptional regulator, partial [Planctomycetota bacterium]
MMEALRKASPLLGDSPAIKELRDFIVGVSLLTEPVLLTGPSGTGKSLSARKIHAVGRTARAPFIRVGCEQFTESELDKLLFDGDDLQDLGGLLGSRSGGTCYLSGIEKLPPSIVERLTQYLAASRKCEEQPRLIFSSRFPREELLEDNLVDATFVELASPFHIWIPPLRDRIEDIPVLCSYQLWMNTPVADYEGRWSCFQEDVLPSLISYPWPGNVNELNGVVRNYCDDEAVSFSVPELVDIPDEVPASEFFAQQLEIFYAELLGVLETDGHAGEQLP